RELAMTLKEAGVRDPAALLKQNVAPEAREQLAKSFGLTRGQLTVHLSRAELLSIGAGRNGEQALRPQHLPALSQANIVTLKQLGGVHSLAPEQFAAVYASVRESFS